MRIVAIIGLLIMSLAGCDGDSKPEEKATSDTIERVDTPFREHGYSNFNNRVIASAEGLASFIAAVELQSGWNDKSTFISAIEGANIDFSSHNLMLFRITETSGSISLTPQAPTTSGTTVYVDITRNVPSAGTADMAYYALAYAVNKNVTEVHFDNGTQLEVIPNTEGVNIAPANCTAWFDGCNECSRSGEQVMCTLKACAAETLEPLRCHTWE